MFVFFGTHSTGPGLGLLRARFDPDTGALSDLALAAEDIAPAHFVIGRDRRHLYTCNSVSEHDGRPGGMVSAHAIDPATGGLTLLNRQSSGGAGPCYVALDRSERFLLVANYRGATVAVVALAPDGSLGALAAVSRHAGQSVHPQRQQRAYPHSIQTDPSNRFALAADLGTDRIVVYAFDAATGALSPHRPPHAATEPGAGPRHFAWHPRGDRLYTINELSGTIATFAWDGERGVLSAGETVPTLPAGFTGENTSAEIGLRPDGRFLYATNRGHDSVAVFALDPGDGSLDFVERVPTLGRTPRYFAFDPSGRWLIVTNHGSGTATVFRVDPASGRLTRAGEPVALASSYGVRFL